MSRKQITGPRLVKMLIKNPGRVGKQLPEIAEIVSEDSLKAVCSYIFDCIPRLVIPANEELQLAMRGFDQKVRLAIAELDTQITILEQDRRRNYEALSALWDKHAPEPAGPVEYFSWLKNRNGSSS